MSFTKKVPREESGIADPKLPVGEPSAAAAIVVDDGRASASIVSHASALRDLLTAKFVDSRPARRWSKRRTLIFILGVCGAFWIAVGWGIYLLVR